MDVETDDVEINVNLKTNCVYQISYNIHMNRYKKTIQTIRSLQEKETQDKKNRIQARKNRQQKRIDFSKKIQKAMELSDEDLKFASDNNISWRLPGSVYVIRYVTFQKTFIVIIDSDSRDVDCFENPPTETKQKKILKLIKENR